MINTRIAQLSMAVFTGIAVATTTLSISAAPAQAGSGHQCGADRHETSRDGAPNVMPNCDTEEPAETPEASALGGIALLGAVMVYQRRKQRTNIATSSLG